MFQSYLKIALRNLRSQRSYTLLNVIGLSLRQLLQRGPLTLNRDLYSICLVAMLKILELQEIGIRQWQVNLKEFYVAICRGYRPFKEPTGVLKKHYTILIRVQA